MTSDTSPPTALTVTAYAKINLTLDVFSKRADGYHSLASVVQAVSLRDTLHLTPRAQAGIHFTCSGPQAFAVPADASNLAVRAVEVALDAAGRRADVGVSLHLEKRIPAQAGLGGGSSDAAATLLGVNALLSLGLDPETRRSLAASLGSDVPFFLTGGTAVLRGRGESVTPLPDVPRLWLVIVKPEENVSTAWAYNELDAVPDRASHRVTRRMEEVVLNGDDERLIAWQGNDFELPVFAHFPRLAWLHDELRMAGALTAHLCGSGSALYGVADSEASAQSIARRFESRYPFVAVAHTLTRAESNPLTATSPVSAGNETEDGTRPGEPESAMEGTSDVG